MSIREIPRDEWASFFESFSRQHDGWLCAVEVLGAPGGQAEPRHQALIDITADLRHQGAESIVINVRDDESRDHVVHIVEAPLHVRFMETEEGAHEGLQLESKHGQTTALRFRSPILPELVDGIVLS